MWPMRVRQIANQSSLSPNILSYKGGRVSKMEDKDLTAYAICQYCGYFSTHKQQCERCKHKFTGATKYVSNSDDKRRQHEHNTTHWQDLDPPNKLSASRGLETRRHGNGAPMATDVGQKNVNDQEAKPYTSNDGKELGWRLDRSNVMLEGGGQFKEGEAYMLSDKQGNRRTVKFIRGAFVSVEIDLEKNQHLDPCIRPGLPTPLKRSLEPSAGSICQICAYANADNVPCESCKHTLTSTTKYVSNSDDKRRKNEHITTHCQDLDPSNNMSASRGLETRRHGNGVLMATDVGQKNVNDQEAKPYASNDGKELGWRLDRSNVVFEGGGQFKEGEAYMLRDKQGNRRKMKFICGAFVSVEKELEKNRQLDPCLRPRTTTSFERSLDASTRAICQYCGYFSADKQQCERCKRKFTNATRYVSNSDDERRKHEHNTTYWQDWDPPNNLSASRGLETRRHGKGVPMATESRNLDPCLRPRTSASFGRSLTNERSIRKVPKRSVSTLSHSSVSSSVPSNGLNVSAVLVPESQNLHHEIEKLKDQRACKICMEKEVCMTFMPCRHLATCEDCAVPLNGCPICRAHVVDKVQVYWS